MKVLVQIIGLQRSGNHFIINWISSLFSKSIHFNNLPHDYFCQPDNVTAIDEMSGIDCIICSFEDCGKHFSGGKLLLESVYHTKCSAFATQRKVLTLYILRDPYNCWASRVKSREDGLLTSSSDLEQFIADWNAIANCHRRHPQSVISYNHMVRSEAYRRAVCARLGGTYSERTLDETPRIGGGSSFEGRPAYGSIIANIHTYLLDPMFLRRFLRDPTGYFRRLVSPIPKGQNLSVEARWQYLAGDPTAARLFTDENISCHSERIFGFSIGPGGVRKEVR